MVTIGLWCIESHVDVSKDQGYDDDDETAHPVGYHSLTSRRQVLKGGLNGTLKDQYKPHPKNGLRDEDEGTKNVIKVVAVVIETHAKATETGEK